MSAFHPDTLGSLWTVMMWQPPPPPILLFSLNMSSLHFCFQWLCICLSLQKAHPGCWALPNFQFGTGRARLKAERACGFLTPFTSAPDGVKTTPFNRNYRVFLACFLPLFWESTPFFYNPIIPTGCHTAPGHCIFVGILCWKYSFPAPTPYPANSNLSLSSQLKINFLMESFPHLLNLGFQSIYDVSPECFSLL